MKKGIKSILVTGANGFIGRQLVNDLKKDYLLYCPVRSTHDQIKSAKVNYLKLDLAKPINIKLLPKTDCVIHLAQANTKEPKMLFEVNERSTIDLLNYSVEGGVKKFIFASTGTVYGLGKESFKESDSIDPTDAYSVSKYNSERWGRVYDQLPFIALRFFGPYGIGQTKRLVPTIISKVKNEEPIPLKRNGSPRINYIYISDVIDVIRRALEYPKSEVINVGGAKPYSIKELSETTGKILGKKPTFETSDEEIGDAIGDISKMEKVLKYRPKISLEKGLEKTIRSKGS